MGTEKQNVPMVVSGDYGKMVSMAILLCNSTDEGQKVVKSKKKGKQATVVMHGVGLQNASRSRSWSPLHVLIIMVLGSILYANAINGPFLFDDVIYIIESPVVKDLRYFVDNSMVESALAKKQLDYNFSTRTVGYFTFALNYKIHGLSVLGYHVFNIVIHILNGILVYALVLLTIQTPFFSNVARKEGPNVQKNIAALIAALLFICHPVHTQAVTYIAQRITSLAVMFCLLSLVMYVRARLAMPEAVGFPEKSSILRFIRWQIIVPYGISVISSILAMKTKEISFTLPLIIALYELSFMKGKVRDRMLLVAPHLLTMLVIPLSILSDKALRFDIDRFVDSIGSTGPDHPMLANLFTQFRVIVTYLRLFLLPINQTVDYDYPVYTSFFHPEVAISFLFLLILGGIAVFIYVQSHRHYEQRSPWSRFIAFGILWFFITLSVESTVLPLDDRIFEHRLYLPSIGLIIGCISVAELVKGRWGLTAAKWVFVSFSIVIAAWAVMTVSRNIVWGESVRFWANAVQRSPNKARPHANLGWAYIEQGHYEDAIRELDRALGIDPNYLPALKNLGALYLQIGNVDAASKVLTKAAGIDKDDPVVLVNMGIIYERMGRFSEAEAAYRSALSKKENMASAYSNLGVLYLKQGRIDSAIEAIREAVRIVPDYADFQYNLGNAYATKGDLPEARLAFHRALAIDPAHAKAREHLRKVDRQDGNSAMLPN